LKAASVIAAVSAELTAKLGAAKAVTTAEMNALGYDELLYFAITKGYMTKGMLTANTAGTMTKRGMIAALLEQWPG
jgi:hypothetical protein